MASANTWRSYQLRQAASRLAPWVIYPCALLGGLSACTSACSSSPQATDVNETLSLATYGSQTVEAFLRSTPAGEVSAKPRGVDPRGGGRFDVRVEVTPTDEPSQEWLVSVLVIGDRPSQRYVTTRRPSRIPSDTPQGEPAEVARPQDVPNDNPAWATVVDFFTAWLTGRGDVDRYSRPNSIPKFSDAPYSEVTLTKLVVSGAVPAKVKGRVDVTATVLATDRYTIEQDYGLTLVAGNGQWVVSAVDAVPPVNPPKETESYQRKGNS
jgi:hypothetical protein